MKKLLLLLLFIPLVSFGQGDCLNGSNIYSGEPCGNGVKVKVETNVKQRTVVQRALNLSDEKTTVKTPLTADLSNYTHLLLVQFSLQKPLCIGMGDLGKGSFENCDERANFLEDLLSLTILEIMNPYSINKKKAKKEPYFLKTVKNESYLYLYLKQGSGRGDDINTTFVIRDWKNKTIYSSTHINTGLNEILNPLIN